MAAILVFQNNETAAMLVYHTNPAGVEVFLMEALSFVPIHYMAAGHVYVSKNALFADAVYIIWIKILRENDFITQSKCYWDFVRNKVNDRGRTEAILNPYRYAAIFLSVLIIWHVPLSLPKSFTYSGLTRTLYRAQVVVLFPAVRYLRCSLMLMGNLSALLLDKHLAGGFPVSLCR